ncbi:MAG: hypothetical protein JXR07_07490 [Reichenbachiella sp.]
MKIQFVILFSFISFRIVGQTTLSNDSINSKYQKENAIDTTELGHTKEFAQKINTFKNIDWDSHVRARHEFWNNQETLNDDIDDLYSFIRVKLHLGGGIRVSENIRIYTRIVSEGRFYGHKGSLDSTVNDYFQERERGKFELLLAQFNFEWKNLLNNKLDIKIGRQNLHDQGFGGQWLIGDGTPLDGSKTFYFNAARFTYSINKYSSLDLVGVINTAEDPLVIYSDNDITRTNITNEQGGWVWYKNKYFDQYPIDFFYLFKHENGGGGYQREEESNIHTVGFHLKPEVGLFWADAQFAAQTGTYGELDRRGLGSIIYAGLQFKNHRSSFKVGPWYMYLSGDDPNTENFEAFNNLFGGYPNDDELYINTWAKESGTSMWTNINLPGLFVEYMPTYKYNLRFWYHYMRANENMTGEFYGQGKERGHMIMFKGMAEFTNNFKAYYMFEFLAAGNFYFQSADNAILNRINLEWYF